MIVNQGSVERLQGVREYTARVATELKLKLEKVVSQDLEFKVLTIF